MLCDIHLLAFLISIILLTLFLKVIPKTIRQMITYYNRIKSVVTQVLSIFVCSTV